MVYKVSSVYKCANSPASNCKEYHFSRQIKIFSLNCISNVQFKVSDIIVYCTSKIKWCVLASSGEGQHVLSQEWHGKTGNISFLKEYTKNTECKSLLI